MALLHPRAGKGGSGEKSKALNSAETRARQIEAIGRAAMTT